MLTLLPGYVGPGASLGVIGALIALAISILVSLGVVLLWPVRALRRKMAAKRAEKEQPASEQP